MILPVKTVAIDCRFAHLSVGIGRYTREIVAHLLQCKDAIAYVLIVLPEGEAWAQSLPGSPRIVLSRSPHYSLREHFEIPRLLRSAGVDLLFSPHFTTPFRCPVPAVITVHDLILHRFPNRAHPLKRFVYRSFFRRSVRRARRVIAVSRFTAAELQSTAGDAAVRKTKVILEGVSPEFVHRSSEEQDAVLQTYGISKPFFLYVGNAKQHKNVQFLIDAFGRISPSPLQLLLVMGGKEAASVRLREGVRYLPHVRDEHLPALYSAATAFVTASLYEGFGLTIAEAAACGCPVIATNRGAIPEVAPPDAVLLPPELEAFAEAMRHPPVTSTPRMFSWKDAAGKTVEVLRQALGS